MTHYKTRIIKAGDDDAKDVIYFPELGVYIEVKEEKLCPHTSFDLYGKCTNCGIPHISLAKGVKGTNWRINY